MFRDLGERPAMGGFGHIPGRHLRPHQFAQIRRAATDPALGPDDDHLRLRNLNQGALHIRNHRRLIGIFRHRWHGLARMAQSDQRHRRPGKPGPIAKGRAASPLFIHQIFQII